MIERCAFCGYEHEVGDVPTYFGAPLKTCPLMPPDLAVFVMPSESDGDSILDAEFIDTD